MRIDLVLYLCDRPPLVVAMLVAMLYLLEHVETWCDGGSLPLTVHTDTRRQDSRKAFRLLKHTLSLSPFLLSFFFTLCVSLSLQFHRAVCVCVCARVLQDAFRTLTVLSAL